MDPADRLGQTILLVEDNEDNRIIYSTVLRHVGYDVIDAEDGVRAIELAGIARHEPELGDHVHVKRVYRFVASADLIDNLERLVPEFAEYMKTLTVKPQRWTRDRLGESIDVQPSIDRKLEAMHAHRTQAPDMKMWLRAREQLPTLLAEEPFVREFPDPHGPLETDLFAALR